MRGIDPQELAIHTVDTKGIDPAHTAIHTVIKNDSNRRDGSTFSSDSHRHQQNMDMRGMDPQQAAIHTDIRLERLIGFTVEVTMSVRACRGKTSKVVEFRDELIKIEIRVKK